MEKYFNLTPNIKIPALGFGTWKLKGRKCEKAVLSALESGYRYIDTADVYGNHKDVAKALKKTDIKREDLFITSKVWRTDLQKENVISCAKRILGELDIAYLDLLLVHWPNKEIPIQDTMEGFQSLKDEGLIRAIGVSNFTINHLKDALATGVEIVNNQIETHPSFFQDDLISFCKDNNILVTAYSPLGQGKDLSLPLLKELAEKYGRSEAQIALNWLVSRGIGVIPKSFKPEYIADNIKALEWQLEDIDLKRIDDLNLGNRLLDPVFSEFDY